MNKSQAEIEFSRENANANASILDGGRPPAPAKPYWISSKPSFSNYGTPLHEPVLFVSVQKNQIPPKLAGV